LRSERERPTTTAAERSALNAGSNPTTAPVTSLGASSYVAADHVAQLLGVEEEGRTRDELRLVR
jgi:hypothetical protein